MKIPFIPTWFYPILLSFLLFVSCKGQEKPKSIQSNNTTSSDILPEQAKDKDIQIGDYIVEIFEDSKGHLWFGTMAKGVARFDGTSLTYFTTQNGLPNDAVVSIIEDANGIIWLGTHGGLSKFDGKKFTNYTKEQGLMYPLISQLVLDRQGHLWIGAWGGICLFDGEKFTEFKLPTPDVVVPPYQETADWVTTIMEDKNGDMWFGRSGYAACKYDGKTFQHFTKKDGLPSNCVQSIHEDKRGQIWMSTRVAEKDHPDPAKRFGDGGLCIYDGRKFKDFPERAGLHKNDVYLLYEEPSGDFWIGASGTGIYRYDGTDFYAFDKTDRMDLTYSFGIQSMLKDSKGTTWLGFSGGLFRLEGDAIVNVTQDYFAK